MGICYPPLPQAAQLTLVGTTSSTPFPPTIKAPDAAKAPCKAGSGIDL